MNKEIEKIAEVISFRLLATRKHPDYNWLEETLKEFKEEDKKYKNLKMDKFRKIINTWYPIAIAFICMCYSIGLGVTGHTEEAQYSAHWAGTILLFAIAIRQRRGR